MVCSLKFLLQDFLIDFYFMFVTLSGVVTPSWLQVTYSAPPWRIWGTL